MNARAAALATVLLGVLGLAHSPGVRATAEATNPALDQLLALLAARRHGHVTFSEVHEMAMLKEPLTSSGELVYDAPDRLEKRTLKPKPEVLVLDHGVLSAQRGRRQHVLELADYPQLVPFVESIRATLAGDRGALEHYFAIGFEGDLAQWTLHLTPKDPTLARAVREVRISGARETLKEVEIRESDGDRSRIAIGPEVPP